MLSFEAALLKQSTPESVYKPLHSYRWRLWHVSSYSVCGIMFAAASICYFPQFDCYVNGSWLFIIGSFGLFFADVAECWYLRLGCAFDKRERAAWEAEVITPSYDHLPKDTIGGVLRRAEVGANSFLSTLASTLYLIGSICYYPTFHELVAGCWLFILASAMIVVAQAWRLYRNGCRNEDRRDRRYRVTNYLKDPWCAGVDFFSGFGAIFYILGSLLFLPSLEKAGLEQAAGATCDLIGGVAFCCSATCMFCRYFVARGMPWNSAQKSDLEGGIC